MTELPQGTVTFLFTDIEGSTQLVKQLGDTYGELLADHKRILREAAEGRDGREVDNQGDSFFFAFARANAALGTAVVAQRALAGHEWPEGVEVRVRMGLHTGEPAVGDERYVGLGVHRAARIGSVAHGGQVLLSSATRELVEEEVGDVSVRELGSYRLKDIDRPERLFQLDINRLQTDFPPLSAEKVAEFTCASFQPHDPNNTNVAQYCNPSLDRQINRALSLQSTNPTAARALWEHIDHVVTDQAAWVPLFNSTGMDILSKRVGNYQHSPDGFGMLLDQLWVR